MFRTILTAVTAALASIVFGALVMLIGIAHSASPWIDRLIRVWARLIVAAAGVRLSVENLGRIDPKQRYIIIANHSSWLDIPCMLAGISTQPIRFLAKVSLFKIPIFGWGLTAAGFIPIDRKNRRTAVRSFDLAAERIRKGNTIVVFPEEGRSRERRMRPFKRGAFLLALRSELPIVPVAISGTYDVLPATRTSIRPGRVVLRVCEPIETEGISVKEREDLAATTRKIIGTLLFGAEQYARMEGAAETPERPGNQKED